MEFGNSGMLNEGMTNERQAPQMSTLLIQACADGIHVDMDRLKKGEVK